MSSVEEIVNKSLNVFNDDRKIRAKAACVSDHGVMFGLYELFDLAKKNDQKAIASFEAYVADDLYKKKNNEGENSREHLLLMAKNEEGYKKLSYWCSVGCTDGFYYKPRIDDNLMMKTGGDNIIATSACIGGRIPQLIIADKMKEAEEAIKFYKDLFEEFYLEIQPTQEPSQSKINMELLKFGEKLDIPLICTSDSHYTSKDESEIHSMLLAMQTQRLYDDPTRWRFKGDTYYIMNSDQMREAFTWKEHNLFPKDALEEAIKNTAKIADKCNFQLKTGKAYLPKVNIDLSNNKEFMKYNEAHKENSINENYIKYLCIKGLKEKGLTSKEYRDRINMELDVIKDMGFVDYFLIYEDIIRYCKEADISVGPGRGCFTPDNLVRLANNKKKLINEIKKGDKVKGHTEEEKEVLTTFEYDCDEEITNLQTDNGKQIKCTKDHKIFAIKEEDWNKGIRKPQWYSADELKEGDLIADLEED